MPIGWHSYYPLKLARGFSTILISSAVLIGFCAVLAPSSISLAALGGSLPFAAVIAIVGLGQLLVVQQRGFDLSVAGGVSLAVVISAHIPAGNNDLVLPAVLMAFGAALIAGLINGFLVGVVRVNPVIATIGMNGLLYGAVFAVSGGVPIITTTLLQSITGGVTFGIPHSLMIAVGVLVLVSFLLKSTVYGRQFEVIGANPQAARAVGLRVKSNELGAYVGAQLLYCLAGVVLAGVLREPTAFQGDALLLPSIAVVVLGGTSLLGGRGFPISTFLSALFLNQLSQFALSIGVPYSSSNHNSSLGSWAWNRRLFCPSDW